MDDSKLKACATGGEVPYGFIQWKGTDVCMDLHCVCGFHGHVDGDFFYFYKCQCGRVYEVGVHVPLLLVTDADILKELETDGRLTMSTDL